VLRDQGTCRGAGGSGRFIRRKAMNRLTLEEEQQQQKRERERERGLLNNHKVTDGR